MGGQQDLRGEIFPSENPIMGKSNYWEKIFPDPVDGQLNWQMHCQRQG